MKRIIVLIALVAMVAALCAGPARAWNFIHITDPHVGEGGDINGATFGKVVTKIKTLSPQPDFVLVSGDMVEDGMTLTGGVNDANWVNLTKSLTKTGNKFFLPGTTIPIYFTPGNHDLRWWLITWGLGGYDKYLPKVPDGCTAGGAGDAERDYYFKNKGHLVYSLYSGQDEEFSGIGFIRPIPRSQGLKDAQMTALFLAVKNNPAPACTTITIFMHHSAVDQDGDGVITENRTKFLDSLDAWKTRY